MPKFLVFPEDMGGVKETLHNYPSFQGYPWIVYGETHRKLHLGFNGEDVNLSLDWYASGYDAGYASSAPLVRLDLSLAQRRNPVPRTKGTWSKKYQIWIPAKYEKRYFAWEKVPAELPKVMLTMFDKTQKRRLHAAYASLAEVFSPAVEHYELHGDTGDYAESRLTEEEEVNDVAWREIGRWAEDEWVGGGSIGKDYAIFYSSSGALSLRFEAFKHGPDLPRVLYSIRLGSGHGTDFNLIFSEGKEIPATLNDFLSLRGEEQRKNFANPTSPGTTRTIRKAISTMQAATGYQSLAEVYEYVMNRLRAPVEHSELHTDTSEYEESLRNEESIMKEASPKAQEKLLRTLALFLRFVKAFDPKFNHWANLGNVEITADNPVWKTGGGGILKAAVEVSKKFPMTVDTPLYSGLVMNKPNGYNLGIERITNVKTVTVLNANQSNRWLNYKETVVNFKDIQDWQGAVFLVDRETVYNVRGTALEAMEAAKSIRYFFKAPAAVPSVESLAGVHSFKKVAPAQLADVEVFTRTAEAEALDNPVGRAAAIRQGSMGYATPEYEKLYSNLQEPDFKEKITEAWANFIKLFAGVEHEELHTDTSGYDEGISSPSASATTTVKIPETRAKLVEAARRWQEYPESEAEVSSHSVSFRRKILMSGGRWEPTWNIVVVPGEFYQAVLHPLHLTFPNFPKGAIPDDPEFVYAEMVRHCQEDSEALRRLKGVKPATAAHWEKQFLLGINLEKKVPEESFPKQPIAELPAYFDKFRSVPAAVGESDLRLAIEVDLTALGE